jgi:hypothetical protein
MMIIGVSEDPIFCDLQFQRMFGVTKDIAKKLVQVCVECRPDVFFDNVTNLKTIPAHVKILCVLKSLRFGVSHSAFRDYFEMGEETVRVAFHAFCEALCQSDELLAAFLPDCMTREDTQKLVKRHKEKHGMDGIRFDSLLNTTKLYRY